MILPVFSLYADDFAGTTPLLTGLAIGIYGLTQGLFQLPFGFLSDRFGRKRVIVAAEPERPVNTISLSRGKVTSIFFRLCVLAPVVMNRKGEHLQLFDTLPSQAVK